MKAELGHVGLDYLTGDPGARTYMSDGARCSKKNFNYGGAPLKLYVTHPLALLLLFKSIAKCTLKSQEVQSSGRLTRTKKTEHFQSGTECSEDKTSREGSGAGGSGETSDLGPFGVSTLRP